MYEITDEESLRTAIKEYMKFYAEERLQERFHSKTPLEVRKEAFLTDTRIEYPIIQRKIEHMKKLPHKFINHVVVQ